MNKTDNKDLQQYLDFLTEIDACAALESKHATVENPCFISNLDQLAVLSFIGDDVLTFLQGQFSNDINLVGETCSQLSSYSSPQGRLYATFRIFFYQGQIHLSLNKSLLDKLLKRLNMFVLRSKVSITNCSELIVATGIGGHESESVLLSYFEQLPQQDHESICNKDITIIRMPGTPTRFEIYANPSNMLDIWKKLKPQAQAVDPLIWKLYHIRAGIPNIVAQTSEAFVAQMVNLDLINAINFKKGCYPGQEVIARLHYRGKSKRRMFYMRLDTDTPISAGATIYRFNRSRYQSLAEIVDAVYIEDNGVEALAVIQHDHLDGQTSGRCYLADEQDNYKEITFEILELPYSISLE